MLKKSHNKVSVITLAITILVAGIAVGLLLTSVGCDREEQPQTVEELVPPSTPEPAGTPEPADTPKPADIPEPSPSADPPEALDSTIYTAFRAVLEEKVAELGLSDGWDSGLWRAALIDFDDDGIEELVFYYSFFDDYQITGGYSVYWYDNISERAYLVFDYKGMIGEPEDMQSNIRLRPEVSIFRGADDTIYLRRLMSKYGDSGSLHGAYYTLINNEWRAVLQWDENHLTNEWDAPYTINDLDNVREEDALAEFEKYEAELLFVLRDWYLDFESHHEGPQVDYENNINEILQILATNAG